MSLFIILPAIIFCFNPALRILKNFKLQVGISLFLFLIFASSGKPLLYCAYIHGVYMVCVLPVFIFTVE